jgi:putative flippase GtrA
VVLEYFEDRQDVVPPRALVPQALKFVIVGAVTAVVDEAIAGSIGSVGDAIDKGLAS